MIARAEIDIKPIKEVIIEKDQQQADGGNV
jgi:hypothetical protein